MRSWRRPRRSSHRVEVNNVSRTLLVGVVLLAVLATVSSVSAVVDDTVFIPGRRQEFCGGKTGRVDKIKLLQAIVDDARVPFRLLDRANPAGTSDGGVTPDELLYAITATEPFGTPAKDLGSAAEQAARRLQTVRGALNDFVERNPTPAASGYRVTRTGTGPVRARDIFSPTSNIVIECIPVASDAPPSTPAAEAPVEKGEEARTGLAAINDRIRIRGDVDQLGIPRSDLVGAAAEWAKISFKRNELSHTDTFRVNAVVGFEMAGGTDRTSWQFIPYVHYQRNDVRPDSAQNPDVHTVSPGALIGTRLLLDRSFFDIGIEPEATFDIAQKSRVVKAKFFVDPSFRIGREGSDFPVLGGYMDEIGPIALRPAAKLVGELAYVADKGTNSALEDERSYFGLGLEASLHLRVPFVPMLENFVAGVRYRYLGLFGTNLSSAHRTTASLSYQFSSFLAAVFEYVDGRNMDTFQKERFWSIALSLRY